MNWLLSSLIKRDLHTIQPTNMVTEAAGLMCDKNVGALVITDEGRVTPLGIITDRDLVWMIAEGLDPRESTVSQFVGKLDVHTAFVTDSLDAIVKKMRMNKVRRLPIVDVENRLVGIISLDDIVVLLGSELYDVATTITGEIEDERAISGHRKSDGSLAHDYR